jgi:hypothetical protein
MAEHEVVRDAYGFAVAQDCVALARIYAPVYLKDEEDRCRSWDAFMDAAAAQLGAGAPAAADPDETRAALAAAVLPAVLSERGAPLSPDLSRLVRGGVPAALRPAVWPLLLQARRAAPAGRYESLLRVVELGERWRAGG